MIDGVKVVIVVAKARNGVIGREGDMPWRLSSDLRRFKALTMGKPVVMGRKTLESLPKLLPGRPHVVVTRNAGFAAPDGVTVAHSLEDGLAIAARLAKERGVDEICVLGGGDIYRQALPLADLLHVTHVEAEPEGDTTFPDIPPERWTVGEEVEVPAGERDDHATVYRLYRRRA
ncbi:dihydrofolate reductase [Rhizobiaceae bacterium BDR2-2]|uniref:Dihydrofolate reductase n=1 Tax=Ectorhizobium quercum TaxID=2965071 RepID=A0AAE3MWT0_9HYPH|nr:dihydrofolate reductase [Ectorhizobium quercum]MCX8996418.1 dihydrofolate reductase [Ectorhizobium quercum]